MLLPTTSPKDRATSGLSYRIPNHDMLSKNIHPLQLLPLLHVPDLLGLPLFLLPEMASIEQCAGVEMQAFGMKS
jgi:hypothetical protein